MLIFKRVIFALISTLTLYTGYAGWHVTAGIPVKFGTAHGRSRPEVGSAKRIDFYGSGGVSRPSCLIGKSVQNIIILTDILRPKHNFFSLTDCGLEQYSQNGSENKVLLP